MLVYLACTNNFGNVKSGENRIMILCEKIETAGKLTYVTCLTGKEILW